MSRRNSGKSILANFGAFSEEKSGERNQLDANVVADGTMALKVPERVGAGVIGATQRSLSELREQRDRLQAIVESGGTIELRPEVVDPSPFPDRLEDDSNHAFEEFKQLIAEKGQQVPVQVRRHPAADGRYQIVYGHRRWRAATELGIPLKAIVLDLDDNELVVAQGIENGARQDLTWIEKALFAATMDAAGIRARDIRAALSIDDAELAKMRSVCRSLSSKLIAKIGRGPKIGRPRWLELSAAVVDNPDAEQLLEKTLSADKVLGASSDDRFRAALRSLKGKTVKEPATIELKRPDGTAFGKVTIAKGSVRMVLQKDEADGFAEFLEREMGCLVERYFADDGDK
jgi:ParB family chromosome partitioning protein